MSDVTRILSQIEEGDPQAAEKLLPLVYDELRKLAAVKLSQEKPSQTLSATALVHEAYLRLVEKAGDGHGRSRGDEQQWNSRGHFFGAAAEAMRRILIENARRKGRIKRGGQRQRVALESVAAALDTPADELLALDEALRDLAVEYQESAELVQLRFFGGLSLGEAAAALGIPRRTADRHWAFARAWLFERLTTPDGDPAA